MKIVLYRNTANWYRINGVVLHKVNWITFIDKELLFMNEDAQNIPISSINLENLNSIMIHTNEGIKEVL